LVGNTVLTQQRWGFLFASTPTVAISFLLVFAVVAKAQDPFLACSPSEKFIQIKVTAISVPASGSAPQRLVWVLSEVSKPEDVRLTPADEILKSRIVEIFQMISDSHVQVGVGRGGDPQAGDPPQLELQLADLDSVRPGLQINLPARLLTPPQTIDLTQTHTARICLQYETAAPPVAIEFEIETARSETSPLPNIPLFKMADANEKFRNRPEGTIRIRIAYAKQDVEDARTNPTVNSADNAMAQVTKDLLNVAAKAFDIAVTKGLLNSEGKPLVDRNSGREIAGNVQSELAKLYDLNGFDPKVTWGLVVPRVGVRDNTPNAPWVISISHLEFAQGVEIEVVKNPVEMEFDGSSTEKKLDERRRRVRDKLNADHLREFAARPGTIITTADIANDQEVLRNDKQAVQSVGDVRSSGDHHDLIYSVSRHLRAEQILNLKVGASYSPEEQLTGTIAFEESNILRWAEAATLSYSGGPQTQRIRFNFDRPFAQAETAGWHVKSLGVNVQYFSDNDTRFGNLTPEEIALREAGSSAQVSFGYDSFSLLDHATIDCLDNADRKRTRIGLLVTPSLSFRDVNLKDQQFITTITGIDELLLPRARTQSTTLNLDISGGLSHDFRSSGKGGVFGVNVQSQMRRGFRFFGGDYDYNKVNVTMTSELIFGLTSSKDILLRYNRVMGTSTRGTPIFELQRLGGPLTVRGFEEGEVIGRKLSADQFELGVNALVVWHLLSRRSVSERLATTDCLGVGESQLPFEINNAYLKVFYDRGRVHDGDSFVGPVTIDRVAEGYGIAFELRRLGGRNINLSIGYAYSPQSVLHKHGTTYTGVSYAF